MKQLPGQLADALPREKTTVRIDLEEFSDEEKLKKKNEQNQSTSRLFSGDMKGF